MIILIIVLASITGYILLTQKDSDNTSGNETKIDECVNLTGLEKAKCYLDGGYLNESLDVCENFTGEERNLCYQGIALDITKKDTGDLNASIEICNKMSEGRFYCYTYLASIVVKSDTDTAIFLCDLTSPPHICYTTIGRVISHRGVNETIALCRKVNYSTCYKPAAAVTAKNDYKSALLLCRDCANTTNTPCTECYSDVAKEVAFYAPQEAIEICTEGELIAGRYLYPFAYMCQIDAADAISGTNESGAFEICGNLTGVNKASCYFRVVKVSNNTGHIREMCDHMMGVWGEEPNVMRYCRDYA